MKTIKGILGFTWAVLAIVIVPVTYVGNAYFSRQLASSTGVTISPHYTGGEVVQVIDHTSYRTSVHRPVFDGLLGPRNDGFIQVMFGPAAGLPPVIKEGIDYDRDGRNDFLITVDTREEKAGVSTSCPAVGEAVQSYRLKDSFAVRIPLHNTRKENHP